MQHLNRIFPLQKQWMQIDETYKCKREKNYNTLLIIGDKNVHKLSMLFQASVSYGHEGKQVIFICNEAFKTMPLHVHGMPKPDSEMMAHLRFMYMAKLEEFISFLANIHLLAQPPEVLVISDLYFYAAQEQHDKVHHTLTSLCAVIADTINYLSTKSTTLQVLLSSTDTNINHESIYKKYFKNIFQVNKTMQNICEIIEIKRKPRELEKRLTFTCLSESLRLKDFFISADQSGF